MEGAEPLVIMGAERILKENKNLKIVLEISPSTIENFGISTEEYLKRFINLGFKIYDIDMGIDFDKNQTIEKEEEIDNFIKKYKEKTSNLFLIRGKNVKIS